jgi:hypothetical protein
MGFPPPLVPHMNCEPQRPLGLASLPERFMSKQIVVCHLPATARGQNENGEGKYGARTEFVWSCRRSLHGAPS